MKTPRRKGPAGRSERRCALGGARSEDKPPRSDAQGGAHFSRFERHKARLAIEPEFVERATPLDCAALDLSRHTAVLVRYGELGVSVRLRFVKRRPRFGKMTPAERVAYAREAEALASLTFAVCDENSGPSPVIPGGRG